MAFHGFHGKDQSNEKRDLLPSLTLHELNAETMMQYSDFQDHTGFLPENAMEMPLPPQFQLPSKFSLYMHPIELELMLFLNKNCIPPVYFEMAVQVQSNEIF